MTEVRPSQLFLWRKQQRFVNGSKNVSQVDTIGTTDVDVDVDENEEEMGTYATVDYGKGESIPIPGGIEGTYLFPVHDVDGEVAMRSQLRRKSRKPTERGRPMSGDKDDDDDDPFLLRVVASYAHHFHGDTAWKRRWMTASRRRPLDAEQAAFLRQRMRPGSTLETLLQSHGHGNDTESSHHPLAVFVDLWRRNRCGRMFYGTSTHDSSHSASSTRVPLPILHSCDPNVAFVRRRRRRHDQGDESKDDNDDTVVSPSAVFDLVTLRDIKAGEELTTSWFLVGNDDTTMTNNTLSWLWSSPQWILTPPRVRQKRMPRDLWDDAMEDNGAYEAATVEPCPLCHPRGDGRYRVLEEDTAWDDDGLVSYVVVGQTEGSTTTSTSTLCPRTGAKPPVSAFPTETVRHNIENRIVDRLTSNSTTTTTTEEEEEELDGRLHHLASSILGARHWTTNFMAHRILVATVAKFHRALLLSGVSATNTAVRVHVDLDELAEAVDHLQRLWRFADAVATSSSTSTPTSARTIVTWWLFRPTLGIARTLVSLGDPKSVAYGAEWASKLVDHAHAYEDPDVAHVVRAMVDGKGMATSTPTTTTIPSSDTVAKDAKATTPLVPFEEEEVYDRDEDGCTPSKKTKTVPL